MKHSALTQLVQPAFPDSTITRVRRLRGGLSAHVHALDLRLDDGTREKVVLRRHGPEGRFNPRDQAIREYKTLEALEHTDVPAPRPLFLDADGQLGAGPFILITHLGRPVLAPRDPGPWLTGLAGALASVHVVTADRADLAHLDSRSPHDMRQAIEQGPRESIRADSLARAVAGRLKTGFDTVRWDRPSLVHDDYWPGNVIWRRRRLTGIVDWATSHVGDYRSDVSQCRVDLTLMHGGEMADRFGEAYASAAGRLPPDMWFFDCYVGLRALASFERWLPGYHDLGLTHLTKETLELRLRTFLEQALNAS